MPNSVFDCWLYFGICNFLWFFKIAKSLSFKECIWVKSWFSVHIQIKCLYAGYLSGLDNEIIFIVASKDTCWSVGTNAVHLSDYCWQQELIALVLQWPCGHWTCVIHEVTDSHQSLVSWLLCIEISEGCGNLEGISLSMNFYWFFVKKWVRLSFTIAFCFPILGQEYIHVVIFFCMLAIYCF